MARSPWQSHGPLVEGQYLHNLEHGGMGQDRIALVAWHWVEFLDQYDQAEISRFYEVHVNTGPEKIA